MVNQSDSGIRLFDGYFKNEIDFDRRIQRQNRNADSGAGVTTFLAKDFGQKIGAGVEH